MQVLLTTALNFDVIGSHISSFSAACSSTIQSKYFREDNAFGLSYGSQNQYDNMILESNDYYSLCHHGDQSKPIGEFISLNIEDMARSGFFVDQSCIIYEKSQDLVWLVGDSMGDYPLWYSFHNNMYKSQFLATSDIILASKLSFDEMNYIGPGDIIGISLEHKEIMYMLSVSSLVSPKSKMLPSIMSLSNQLFRLGLESFQSAKLDDEIPIIFQNDKINPIGSGLIKCLLRRFSIPHTIFETQVKFISIVDIQSNIDAPLLSSFFDGVFELLKAHKKSTKVRIEKLESIILEKWRLVHLASQTGSQILFDSVGGVGHRDPLEAYFVNLFCQFLRVSCRNIFANRLFVEQLIYKTQNNIQKSMLLSANQLLIHRGLCPSMSYSMNRSTVVTLNKSSKTHLFDIVEISEEFNNTHFATNNADIADANHFGLDVDPSYVDSMDEAVQYVINL